MAEQQAEPVFFSVTIKVDKKGFVGELTLRERKHTKANLINLTHDGIKLWSLNPSSQVKACFCATQNIGGSAKLTEARFRAVLEVATLYFCAFQKTNQKEPVSHDDYKRSNLGEFSEEVLLENSK